MTVARQISVDPGAFKRSKPREYLLRFVFGGIVTAAVGIVGTAFGPTVAGVFLAFPAILPASVTLIERHEHSGAAGADALGAAAGSIGLLAFGGIVWGLAPRAPAVLVLALALIAWLAVSVVVWWGTMRLREMRRPG